MWQSPTLQTFPPLPLQTWVRTRISNHEQTIMSCLACQLCRVARSRAASPPRSPQTSTARLRSRSSRCPLVEFPAALSLCLTARSAPPPTRHAADARHSPPPPRAPRSPPCSQGAPQKRHQQHHPHSSRALWQSRLMTLIFAPELDTFLEEARFATKQQF